MISRRVQGFTESVIREMTRVVSQHGGVNLAQGMPDFPPPRELLEAAHRAIDGDFHQYAITWGTPSLRRAIADKYRRFYGMELDPDRHITVCCGSTETMLSTLLAVLNPGDEVVVFEPFYDAYLPGVAMAQAEARVVPLVPPAFRLDLAALKAAISEKTRLVLLNSPSNPACSVFTRAELEAIAALAVRHDLVVVTDEVYEHIVFEGAHVPIASLPGMRERTVSISSAGKTFSLTGWKIGWACAAPALTAAVRAVHQFVTFAVSTPFQHAVAAALATGDAYYTALRDDYRTRRDRLCDGLEAAGFGVLRPAGTYFALADVGPLGFHDDRAFCRHLVETIGVAAIPVSAFALERRLKHLVRFAFCKDDATLDEALRRLRKLKA